jgi:hypothetical protein
MEIAKYADIRSAQNAGKPHGHRDTLDCLAAEIRRNFNRLKKGIDFQNDFRAGLSLYSCNSATLLDAFISHAGGIDARLLRIWVHRPLVFLRILPGKVFEKFQIFSDTTVGLVASFRLWERRLPICSRNERRNQYPRNEKRVKELAILCAMNPKLSFKSVPDPSAKLLDLGATD